MEYLIPIPAFALLLALSVSRNRKDLTCPSVILGAQYLVMAICAAFVSVEISQGDGLLDNPFVAIAAYAVGLIVALLPSLFIRPIRLSLDTIESEVGKWPILAASIYGYYAVAVLMPYFVKSLSMNAYGLRELGESEIVDGSLLLRTAIAASSLSSIYGLVLFSDHEYRLSWFRRMGLIAGFISYGMMVQLHKGRDAMVYYPFMLVLYYWLFHKQWSEKTRTMYRRLLGIGGGVCVALFLIFTMQRFGKGTVDPDVHNGTIDYLGQQVYTFAGIVSDDSVPEGHREFLFPAYYYLLDGRWFDVSEFLNGRSRWYESRFGTFLGSLYLAFQWKGLVIFVILFSVAFAALFRRMSSSFAVSYGLLVILYFQFMFQGAFYWMFCGRQGNIAALALIAGSIFCWMKRRIGLLYWPQSCVVARAHARRDGSAADCSVR
ncbi:MAG: O-antigen polymerase [Verrucomicrobiota bacterium]|jgi:oligosaccharide repeat unit polymerase